MNCKNCGGMLEPFIFEPAGAALSHPATELGSGRDRQRNWRWGTVSAEGAEARARCKRRFEGGLESDSSLCFTAAHGVPLHWESGSWPLADGLAQRSDARASSQDRQWLEAPGAVSKLDPGELSYWLARSDRYRRQYPGYLHEAFAERGNLLVRRST